MIFQIHSVLATSLIALALTGCGKSSGKDPVVPGERPGDNPGDLVDDNTEGPSSACLQEQKEQVTSGLGLTDSSSLGDFLTIFAKKDDSFFKSLTYCSKEPGS